METLIEKAPWIVLILIVLYICYRLWKAGRYREPDKEIYEKELRKRKPFECPYDLKSCDYVDTSTMTIAIQCQDCKRYNKGIRPMEKPGYCGKEIMEVRKTLCYSTAKFINSLHGRIADMGCFNAKSAYIGDYFNINIEQVDSDDFNYWTVPQGYKNAFDVVLCLEVLEHLQNPLLFMRNVKGMLKPGGVIYLSTPARPRILWTKHHFFEMNKKHLTKWILNPLRLEIVKSKKLRLRHP